jgi:hypothetical protein
MLKEDLYISTRPVRQYLILQVVQAEVLDSMCIPDGGKWSNKTTYDWQNNPGYLYSNNSIDSGEFTTYIRVHGDLHKHQAYAHKIGGRDEDPIRSLIEMVYPTASHSNITVNYNYALCLCLA